MLKMSSKYILVELEKDARRGLVEGEVVLLDAGL